MRSLLPCALLLGCLLFGSRSAHARDYQFDGRISEPVLRSYLSRAQTVMYFLTGYGNFEDNLRMLESCGTKFAGRSVYVWGGETGLPHRLELARKNAQRVHAVDPEMILQACIFEIVSQQVDQLPVPAWAFEALDMPVEKRNFRYDDIIYADGRFHNQWGKGSSVPDVSRPETKLWFYYLAASYIDLGCEAIHFGQVELMNKNDPKLDHWAEVLRLTREYAAKHARRHFVLCDAHVPGGGFVKDGRLLMDFHTFPLRIEELADHPFDAQLRVGFKDSLFGRSHGGLTPSGWECAHLPYLVEFDNYGRSQQLGQSGTGVFWVWGWDEITWLSQLPSKKRADWLRYAWSWVREHDAEGYVQMPGARCLSGMPNGLKWYAANSFSAATPGGFGDEDTIREIWASDSAAIEPAR